MTTTDDNIVTDERAAMLAQHAIHVQGGYSDPERERARAEDQIAKGGSIDWDAMQAEVDAALRAKVAALPPVAPAPPTAPAAAQRKDVSDIVAHIDSAASLRERIGKLKEQYDVHAKAITDELGAATEGVDAAGNVLVRYPHRNRSGLKKALVKAKLSVEDYAECETVTQYRVLLFGENDA